MKLNKINFSLLSFCLIFSLFSACNNLTGIMDSPDKKNPEVNRDGMIALDVDIEESLSRTAVPQTKKEDLKDLYLLCNDGTNDQTFGPWDTLEKMKGEKVYLKAGTYTFSLYAYQEDMLFRGDKTDFKFDQNNNSINFNLGFVTKNSSRYGKGELKINLAFPNRNDNVKKVTAGLYKLNGESVVTGFDDEELSILSGGNVTYDPNRKIPAGNYIAVFNFFADDAKTVKLGSYREAVIIANNLLSTSDCKLEMLGEPFSITYSYGPYFKLKDGTEVKSCYTPYNYAFTLPEVENITVDYEFVGWVCEQFPNQIFKANQTVYGTGKNLTFTVKEKRNNKIIYHSRTGKFKDAEGNDKTEIEQITQKDEDYLYSIKQLKVSGATAFLGWMKEDDAKADIVFNDADLVKKSDFTNGILNLYAKYSDSLINPIDRASSGDFDKDGLCDWDEIYETKTDPKCDDTDGDGWSDKEEYDLSKGDKGAVSFNPLVADLPSFEIEIDGNPTISLKYSKTEGMETSDSITLSSSSSESTQYSKGNEHSATYNHSVTVGFHAGYSNGGPDIGGNFEYSHNWGVSNSYNISQSKAAELSKSYSNGKTYTNNEAKTVDGAILYVNIKIKNTGNIAFNIDNLIIGLKCKTGFDPDGSYTISNFNNNDTKITLRPGEKTSNSITLSVNLTNQEYEYLIKNSPAFVLYDAGSKISMNGTYGSLNQRDFTQEYTKTANKCAEINIDFGPESKMLSKKYLVACNNKYNPEATEISKIYSDATLQEVLKNLNLDPEFDNNSGELISLCGINNANSFKDGKWYIFRETNESQNTRKCYYYNFFGTTNDTAVTDIRNLPVSKRDKFTIVYDKDEDEDGVLLNEELLFGTSDKIKDTDKDGISDFAEIYGWNVEWDKNTINSFNMEKLHNLSTEEVKKLIHTNPILNDTDGDNILDGDDPEPLKSALSGNSEINTITFNDNETGSKVAVLSGKSLIPVANTDYIQVSQIYTDKLFVKINPVSNHSEISYKFNNGAEQKITNFIINNLALKGGYNYLEISVKSETGIKKVYTFRIESELGSYKDSNAFLINSPYDYVEKKQNISFESNTNFSLIDSRYKGIFIHCIKPDSESDTYEKHRINVSKDLLNQYLNKKDLKFSENQTEFFYACEYQNMQTVTIPNIPKNNSYLVGIYGYATEDNITASRLIYSDKIETTFNNKRRKLSFYPYYVHEPGPSNDGTNPTYCWTFEQTNYTNLSNFNVARDDRIELDEDKRNFVLFSEVLANTEKFTKYTEKPVYYKDFDWDHPSIDNIKYVTKDYGTNLPQDGAEISIKVIMYETDSSSSNDLLGVGNILKLKYNAKDDTWSVTGVFNPNETPSSGNLSQRKSSRETNLAKPLSAVPELYGFNGNEYFFDLIENTLDRPHNTRLGFRLAWEWY